MTVDNEPFGDSFSLKAISIYRAGDDETPYANLMSMATHFYYHEDIMLPAYGGELVVVDNAENLVSSMPITGWEKVVVEVEKDHIPYEYKFRVWSVGNRIGMDRKQVYTLALISEEGLINEGVHVNRVVGGETSAAIKKVLGEYLGVPEAKVDAEPSATSFKVIPTKKTPFALIRSIQTKTVSAKTTTPTKGSNNTGAITADEKGLTKSDIEGETSKASGTAGYLFYQTREGFVFKSFDSLCSTKSSEFDGKPSVRSFTYNIGNTGEVDTDIIHEIIFTQEIDMIKQMREGTYSSLVCYFNINTGKYDETIYSLADTWKDMVHLGSQTRLPAGQTKLARYPTRVMSTVIDDEKWYNGTEVAKEKSDYPDYQKHFLAQSFSRAGIMFNQQVSISLQGHLDLFAGDKVDIRIPNQVPELMREDEVWDPEHSGTYLIKNLNHQFDIEQRRVHTVLDLIRDSYGIKEKESKVL